MPFYRFECEKCGHRFEELVSYSKRDQVTCPNCAGRTRVLVSAFAAQVGSSGSSAAAPAPRFT
ncbi:FmdB family zinc ribbon protein [Symbiobacterium thermophilum]|uniref:FmdB family zinc ribbon protein n=1 Tax=Symbiobacterium thermophilum TaxID=2734 RepID=UPI0005BB8EC7|nr:zinc ribbon domain-containing protein [Symbiobacterium thermophilum]